MLKSDCLNISHYFRYISSLKSGIKSLHKLIGNKVNIQYLFLCNVARSIYHLTMCRKEITRFLVGVWFNLLFFVGDSARSDPDGELFRFCPVMCDNEIVRFFVGVDLGMLPFVFVDLGDWTVHLVSRKDSKFRCSSRSSSPGWAVSGKSIRSLLAFIALDPVTSVSIALIELRRGRRVLILLVLRYRDLVERLLDSFVRGGFAFCSAQESMADNEVQSSFSVELEVTAITLNDKSKLAVFLF